MLIIYKNIIHNKFYFDKNIQLKYNNKYIHLKVSDQEFL